ncbi:hypothetical protein CTEN210_17941 [Chaetoceros tenuissimus]|uniref:Uncharacterized protein n=1 Tax=Chaetoceros tenuissimus TaxID=426638 RepID=A0AAD3DEE2_9STRA|nr:hypothetical protein CTEN210_17941 [Chaetoceros tenuissimus]
MVLSRTSLSVGDEIVLSRERKGNKRKFNGKRCVVTDYPSRGSWMIVQLLSNKGNEHSTIKWRKGSYSNVITTVNHFSKSSSRMDPMKVLEGCDHIWANIVSYCAEHGVQHDGIWIKDALQIHATLSLVSKSWMSIFNDPLYIGYINVNLNALKSKRVIPIIQWMCRHGSHLSSLDFRVRYDHIPIIEKLLQETNTNNLKNISMRYGEYEVPWIDHTYLMTIELDPHVFDLCTEETDPGLSLEEKANALGMPFASDTSYFELGMRLQESIAMHCPNLQSLCWNRGSAHRQEALVTPLLALPSLKSLKLAIEFRCHKDIQNNDDLYIITKMIQNLRNLQKLEISFEYGYGSTDRKLQIHSQSLRHLDVSGLGKSNFVACKCPLLNKFICNGGDFANGSMPILSQAQIKEYNKNHKGETLVQCQGQMQLPDMDIPNECECIIRNFRPSLGAQKYFVQSGTPIA